MRAAVVGQVNAGKSSLVNALSGEVRALAGHVIHTGRALDFPIDHPDSRSPRDHGHPGAGRRRARPTWRRSSPPMSCCGPSRCTGPIAARTCAP
ncbi:GTPase [Dankookia sp. P2]|uniref:GTPase n=1 Tax=Dankookia sp. P2 TaxID=3423955 RepID=UPI003D673D5C